MIPLATKFKNMKKILLSFSAIIIAAMMLASCSKSSPKDVANTWLTSFYHMEYEAAKKVSTEETKTFISGLQSLSGMMSDSMKKDAKEIKIEIKDVKEVDTLATVTYRLTKAGDAKDAGNDETLKLVKKDGKWLVQFSKNDASEEAMEEEPIEETPATDSTATTTEPAATDSAKH